MRYLLIIFTIMSFSNYVISEEGISASGKISTKEEELHLEAVKEKEVEDQMLNSKYLKECKDKHGEEADLEKRKNETRKCVTEKIGSLSEKDIEELGKQLQLGSFDKKAAKTTKSIREYLNDRLSSAIYGTDTDKSGKLLALKHKNFVDHGVYYQLYMEQMGKNTLLLVSQYCLENFGYDKPEYIIDPTRNLIYPVIEKKLDTSAEQEYVMHKNAKNFSEAPSESSRLPADFWRKGKVREYEVCSKKKLDECDKPNNSRTVQMLEQIKLAEFSLGSTSTDAEFIKKRFNFCATEVLQNMCEIYKCNNVYDGRTDNGIVKNCNDEYGITVSASTTSDEANLKDQNKPKGQLACNIQKRLTNYRAAILATKDLKGNILKTHKVLTQFDSSEFKNSFNDYYDGSKSGGKKKIDELTSISSKELTEKVSDIAGSEEEAKELKENCLDEDENTPGKFSLKEGADKKKECKKLLASTNAETITNIEAETEAHAAVYLKKVKDLNNKEEVVEFIKENGLSKILNQENFESLSDVELKQLITDHYRAEKMSELSAIKQKFAKESKLKEKPVDDSQVLENKNITDEIASNAVGDIEQHRKRVETLFQYSNIVSSYLEVTVDGEKAGSNTIGRELESDNLLEDDSKKYIEQLGDASGNVGENNGSGSQSMDYISALDAILGDVPSSDKKDNNSN